MIPGSANPLLLATAAPTGYNIERSLRFNSADSAYLSRTPASAGNRKTWTWAGWVKRSALGVTQQIFASRPTISPYSLFYFDSGDKLAFDNGISSFTTNAVFRDPGAWYHIVLYWDSTQATASSRIKLYVNNIEQTFSASAYPTQNADGQINTATNHTIGKGGDVTNEYFNGYLADIHFIDGQALTPSSFTEVSATTGQLIPKAYTGSFGTNGFWLKFSDNSAATATTLGKDYSGNNNNWSPTNLSVTAGAGNDSLVDTPTSAGTDTGLGGQVTGNYATLNPLASATSLSNGNLEVNSSGYISIGTIGVSSGKWYFEVTVDTWTLPQQMIGVCTTGIGLTSQLGTDSKGWGMIVQNNVSNGQGLHSGATTSTYTTYGQGDVVNVAFDVDAGKLWFGKNGTWLNSGSPTAGTGAIYTDLSGPIFPATWNNNGGKFTANFGARAFTSTAPSGFKALCDTNLPAPVVAKPNTAFDVALWTGNGSARSITGLNFNPDLVWIKGRSGATDHALYDVVRGAEKRLESNTTDAEVTSDGGVTAFNSDGFSLGTLAQVNTNSSTYVGWAWDGGTSTVTNTQGSITSQVRANASAGFSIVTYTGNGSASATVGHGLGVAPALWIIRARDVVATKNWGTYHTSLGSSKALLLNTTSAVITDSYASSSVAPTSSVVTVKTDGPGWDNVSTANYVMYAWAPVAGYSSGFSYTGNGSADGSFVYLGFRPRLILLKCSSTTGNWTLLDTAREGYNVDNDPLYPNLSNAEGTTDLLDITSNGFKLRTTDASVNSSGATYVGYAWAEAPFAYSRAR